MGEVNAPKATGNKAGVSLQSKHLRILPGNLQKFVEYGRERSHNLRKVFGEFSKIFGNRQKISQNFVIRVVLITNKIIWLLGDKTLEKNLDTSAHSCIIRLFRCQGTEVALTRGEETGNRF